MNTCLKAFLFADLKGFSKIPDHELPGFVTSFLQGAADILHSPESGASVMNTWGDALFAVFDKVELAAETAMRIRDWARTGFMDAVLANAERSVAAGVVSLRISLHAGPVLVGFDPVIQKECFIGQHVVRTARLEPIADAGHILTSEEFAALLATSPAHDRFESHYQGLARLAKDYGRMAAYRLERRKKSNAGTKHTVHPCESS